MIQHILLMLYICGPINSQEVQETTFTISLNNTLSNDELYSNILDIKGLAKTHFVFTDVNKNIAFIVFQMHSHLYNITMRNETCFNDNQINMLNRTCEKLTGTNIGLFSTTGPIPDMSVTNPNANDLKIFIAVHGYVYDDPVPGGCNMEGTIETPPLISTTISPHKDYISITAPEPSPTLAPDQCFMAKGSLKFYMLYLPERDFSIDSYFGGIKAMLSFTKVWEIGEEIPKTHVWGTRRTMSAYPGTGAVFVAVAEFTRGYNSTALTTRHSTYVPSVTYVCSPLVEDDCLLLGDLLSQVLCASLLFVGLFMCYFGHKFFKTEMFMFGMLSGVVVSYILISLMAEMQQAPRGFMCYFGHKFFKTEMFMFGMLSGVVTSYILISLMAEIVQEPLIGASFLSGILFGFIWLTFWWFYGIPVFSVLLITLTMGFFTACALYNHMPGGLTLLFQDLNYWTLFILVMILTAVILTPVTYSANIVCCAILGAYAAIYPIDYCLGSNLKYNIINTVRRATVDKFNYAVLSPPFQKNDALLVLLWVMLAVTGFLFQHYHNRGKPPFPPPPRNIRERPEGYGYGATSPYTRFGAGSDPPTRSTLSTATRRTNENTPLLA